MKRAYEIFTFFLLVCSFIIGWANVDKPLTTGMLFVAVSLIILAVRTK